MKMSKRVTAELGLNIIENQDGFKSWHDAMDAVRARLSIK